jgi:hypothetical protein
MDLLIMKKITLAIAFLLLNITASLAATAITPTLLFNASGAITSESNVQGLAYDGTYFYWGVAGGAEDRIYKLNFSGVTQSYFTTVTEHAGTIIINRDNALLGVSYKDVEENSLIATDGTGEIAYDLTSIPYAWKRFAAWEGGNSYIIASKLADDTLSFTRITISGETATAVKTFKTNISNTSLGTNQDWEGYNGRIYYQTDYDHQDSGEKRITEFTLNEATSTAQITNAWSWTYTTETEGLAINNGIFYIATLDKKVWQVDLTADIGKQTGIIRGGVISSAWHR